MESIAFKEWAIVCEALGHGKQSIILRKGGIAEGREGFAFRHREFFLFPTFFHEQARKTRLQGTTLPARRESEMELRFFAKVEVVRWITSREIAEALEPLHVLKPEVVQERFEYDNRRGLHVAFVRVFELNPTWILANTTSYAGCRSWIRLREAPPNVVFQPVLVDTTHEIRKMQFLKWTEAIPAQSS